MTFKEYCINYCFKRGMFLDQAESVFNLLEADPVMESMKGRWNDFIEGYPKAILAIVVINLSKCAVEWIEKNKPQAWYKNLFEENL